MPAACAKRRWPSPEILPGLAPKDRPFRRNGPGPVRRSPPMLSRGRPFRAVSGGSPDGIQAQRKAEGPPQRGVVGGEKDDAGAVGDGGGEAGGIGWSSSEQVFFRRRAPEGGSAAMAASGCSSIYLCHDPQHPLPEKGRWQEH